MLQKTILNELEADGKTGRGIKGDRDTKAGRRRKVGGGTKTQGRPKAVRETKVELATRIARILDVLDREYSTEYRCYLDHEIPWQLLIVVIMSAQRTDVRVNTTTADLFQRYDTLKRLTAVGLRKLGQDIYSVGFYHMKTKDIIACCRDPVGQFGGEVPRAIEELTSLAGVGRKTANVIRGDIYNESSTMMDTHVEHIPRKLGLAKEEEPEKIEYDLMKVLPKDHWTLWNTHIITLGCTIYIARHPKCCECFLRGECPGREA